MTEAIRLANEARERGDEPFGALLVADNRSILEARNAVNTDGDVTQHAELRLISKAGSRLPTAMVAETTLYASTEPCAMCCGAIYWAGIRHLVFGFPAHRLEEMTGGGGIHRSSRDVLGDATGDIRIEGPILEEEAAGPHRGFW
jgi:tRNA(Arg) A34 adenosine deaminase TadA